MIGGEIPPRQNDVIDVTLAEAVWILAQIPARSGLGGGVVLGQAGKTGFVAQSPSTSFRLSGQALRAWFFVVTGLSGEARKCSTRFWGVFCDDVCQRNAPEVWRLENELLGELRQGCGMWRKTDAAQKNKCSYLI